MVTSVTPRQLAILRHLQRYRISLRPVLDRLFYADQSDACRHDLDVLRGKSLVQMVKSAIPDVDRPQVRYSYYSLAPEGARWLGLASTKLVRVGSDALTRHLAHLHYCCFSRRRRHRLLKGEVERLFASAAASLPVANMSRAIDGFHCLDRHGDQFTVQQLYAPQTPAAEILMELRKRLRQAEEHPLLRRALYSHQYGIVVLTAAAELQREVRRLLDQEYRGIGLSLTVARSPGSWHVTRSAKS